MSKKLEICFLPQNINKEFYCCLCNFTSTSLVGYCNHIKYKHKEITLLDYWKKYCFPNFKNPKNLRFSTGKCLYCGKPTEFRSPATGYKNFCSHGCSSKDPKTQAKKIQNTKRALFKKYGVEYPSQIQGASEKIRQTKFNKYGNENYNNIEKQKETLKKKYGVTCYTQTKEYKIKTRQTSLEKYGVEHFTKADVVKNKCKETTMERYGVQSVLQVPSIREAIKKTTKEKYGGFPFEKTNPNSQKFREIHKKRFEKRLADTQFEHVKLIDTKERKFECLNCHKNFIQKNITLNREAGICFPRCLDCFPVKNNKDSIFQQEVVAFLKGLKINFIENNRILLKDINQEIDIFVPEKGLALELDGLYWHSEIHGKKSTNYHLDKTNRCETQKIQLIHLFADEWEHKREIVKEKIKYLVGYKENNATVYARKCRIEEIKDNKIKNEFLNNNHIQGTEFSSNIKLAAFYNKQIVAMMTFGKPRLSLGNKERREGTYELIRFTTDIKTRCPGIASKLLKYFIRAHKPKLIYSYADRRWTKAFGDNLYTKLSFKIDKTSRPNYWYLSPYTSFKIRENRFKYRKDQLPKLLNENFDKNLSEWENMKASKYDRVWDCGTIKYLFKA